MPNALCYLLPVAKKHSCVNLVQLVDIGKGICLRTLESRNKLGSRFIWDMAIEDCVKVQT